MVSDRDEPGTQKTPKGFTIPIPTRDDFMAALRKVAARPVPDDDEPDP